MDHTASPHDNRTDVRINNKVNIYGNVFFIGSISLVSVGSVFFIIWLTHFWATAVLLSAILVYTLMGLSALAVLGLVVALWIKLVVVPGAAAYERVVVSRGQDWRNRLIHAQENAVVVSDSTTGQLRVVPLLAPVVEAEKPEPIADKATVLELHTIGLSLRDIAAKTGVSYHYVQKWCKAEDDKNKPKTSD